MPATTEGAAVLVTAMSAEALTLVLAVLLLLAGFGSVVVLFTLAVSLLASVVFGSIPVFKYAAPHLAPALRAGGRSVSQSRERHRVRSTLVVVQVGLALLLLIGSGLMIRTFQTLRNVQPGFTRPDEVQMLRIFIPEAQVHDPVAVVRMQQGILEKIAGVPGVTSVAFTSKVPLDGFGWHDPIYAQDRVYAESQLPPLRSFKMISPGLLKTMGNTLVTGRDLTWTDVYEKRPVVLVSENLARELWHDPAAALGKRIRESRKSAWREVIGVVNDERDDGVNQKAPATVLWPSLMDNFTADDSFLQRSVTIVVRSSRTGSSGFLDEVSRAVWSVNPNLPLASVRTLAEVYRKSLARTSFTLVMLAIAGGMALLLGVIGIYGVIAYAVSQRTREIGIRMALGSSRQDVTRLFVAHGLRLAAVGIACGIAASAACTRLMSSLLFEVSPLDPVTFGGVSLMLVLAAAVASYVPALRAAGVDPVEALRADRAAGRACSSETPGVEGRYGLLPERGSRIVRFAPCSPMRDRRFPVCQCARHGQNLSRRKELDGELATRFFQLRLALAGPCGPPAWSMEDWWIDIESPLPRSGGPFDPAADHPGQS